MTKHCPDDQANLSHPCAHYSAGRPLAPASYARHLDRVLGYGQQHRCGDYRRRVGLSIEPAGRALLGACVLALLAAWILVHAEIFLLSLIP